MAIQEMELDPNAAAYTDDQIVGKVNSATSKVDADQVEDGTTNKVFTSTDETKLTGIAENATIDQTGAEIKTAYEAETDAYTDTKNTKLSGIEDSATADQTGVEVRDAIVGLGDTDRKLVITDPSAGQFKVISLQRKSDGKAGVKYDDVAES